MSKRALYEELSSMHIMALYDFMEPINHDVAFTWEEVEKRKQKAISRYRNDPIFNARVQSMVNNTMFIVEKHADRDGYNETKPDLLCGNPGRGVLKK